MRIIRIIPWINRFGTLFIPCSSIFFTVQLLPLLPLPSFVLFSASVDRVPQNDNSIQQGEPHVPNISDMYTLALMPPPPPHDELVPYTPTYSDVYLGRGCRNYLAAISQALCDVSVVLKSRRYTSLQSKPKRVNSAF